MSLSAAVYATTDPAIEVIDAEAFGRLYRECFPDVLSLCRTLLGPSGEAEDVAQEAFLRAWLARHRYSPLRPFWPWVATIARRLCIDRRRRAARDVTRQEGLEFVDESHERPAEHVVEAGEELRIVLRAVAALRPSERRVLILRELDGCSYRQIATLEGVTVESVRGSLKRARASLREVLPPPQL